MIKKILTMEVDMNFTKTLLAGILVVVVMIALTALQGCIAPHGVIRGATIKLGEGASVENVKL